MIVAEKADEVGHNSVRCPGYYPGSSNNKTSYETFNSTFGWLMIAVAMNVLG